MIDDDPLEAMKALGVSTPKEPWSNVLRRDPCVYCGTRSRDITIDHISAKSKGHRRAGVTNGAPSCFACNQTKADDSLLMYLARRISPRRSTPRTHKLQVLLTDTFRQRAHLLLGRCPGVDWWTTIAHRIKSKPLDVKVRTRRSREDFVWIAPVVSTDGVDAELHLEVRTHRQNGNVYCVSFLDMKVVLP